MRNNDWKWAPEGKIQEIDPEADDDLSDEAFMARLEKKMYEDDDYSSDDEKDGKSAKPRKDPKLKQTASNFQLSQKEIEAIHKLTQQKNSCCPSIEIILLICLIFCSIFCLTYIPGFIPLDTYANLTQIDQPVCFPVDTAVPGLPRFLIPLFITLFIFFLIKMKDLHLLVATFTGLIICFDSNFIGLMGQSPSVSIMACCIMLSYNIGHNILLKNKVYGLSWFMNLLISYLFAIFPALFRPESLGSILAIYIYYIISTFSEVCGAIGNTTRAALQTMKMFLIGYATVLPCFAIFYFFRSKMGQVPYIHSSFNFKYMQYEFIQHKEKWFFYTYACICLLFIKKAKYSYKSIVPLIQGIVGIIATTFLPYESRLNTYATKLFFIKLHLMLVAGITLGNQKSGYLSYGIPIVFLIISALYKFREIAKYIMERPDAGTELF